jgi:16S rRNA (guanine527-N7)-methyltransferase
MSVEDELAAGLNALDLRLPPEASAKLLKYLELIEKWNRVYNLTAVRRIEDMISHHVLDSLAVAPHLGGATLVDVGSGAGLPGIPLAIARPAMEITLLESNHKKSAFLNQAVIELELANVEVVNARAEAWQPQPFDVVISRAFSEIGEFLALAGRLCAPNTGVLAAMKGVHPYEELSHVRLPYETTAVIPIEVPGLDAQRHLVLMRRKAD